MLAGKTLKTRRRDSEGLRHNLARSTETHFC